MSNQGRPTPVAPISAPSSPPVISFFGDGRVRPPTPYLPEANERLSTRWTGAQNVIRLTQRGGTAQSLEVVFQVTPELSEARTVNYQEISEIRQAGGILIYIGTGLRTYQINARFVSQTTENADLTFAYTHRLKGWTTPNKDGGGAVAAGAGGQNAPEILKLYGYGMGDEAGQIRGVPVVITSLNIDYPNNVSYIKTSNKKADVPIVQNISIALKEARSDIDLENFDIVGFRRGQLRNW